MNILQQEDAVKGLPDDALMQEAQAPSGRMPQFLVVSIQRRADMRESAIRSRRFLRAPWQNRL